MVLLCVALLRAWTAASVLLHRASAEAVSSASSSRVLVASGAENQHEVHERFWSPLPRTYVAAKDLPRAFSWGAANGVSYLTKSMNQHLEQYCGSCFAHAAASVLGDRIKIARGLQAAAAPRNRAAAKSGPYQLHTDVALSVQFLLNCGANHSLSCHGGSTSRAYEFVSDVGFWPYETCQPYLACSSDSQEGFCPHVDTSCTPLNTCKTCMPGAGCVALETFPNATVAEYGVYSHDVHAIMSEIFVRGPVKASVDAVPLVNYTGGVLWDAPEYRSNQHHHGVSLVGWGYDADKEKQYWIARNSWGEYWGEMGYFRVELGKNLLMIESNVAWATPGTFTVHNVPCSVDGDDCDTGHLTYVDPSRNVASVQRRLRRHSRGAH